MSKSITIEAIINAPVEKVWQFWNQPEHITKWAFASYDWEAPNAENDLKVGGKFKTVMAAKNKSSKFDFTGTYSTVDQYKEIAYTIDGDDARKVVIAFENLGDKTKVTETFEMENENTEELQRSGWQAILDNFKKHVEVN